METYDVIIVGAGPAGLTCAETLAKAKKKVLVLEKNKIIGPKVCAGGLTYKDLKLIPKNIGKSFKKVIVHTPNRTAVIKQKKPIIITIDRKTLGQIMLKKAIKAGAIIRTNMNVSKIKKNSIIANNKEIKFKYLIGADGSASLVRKSLGLKTKKIFLPIQYIIKKNQNKNLEFFFNSKLFPLGYAWIFPHKNYTSIGCDCDPRFLSTKKLKKNFHKWLKMKKINVSTKFEAVPINYDYQGYEFKNKFLIGDAAGFASGLTGEGIYFAIISGKEVAKLIINKKYKPKEINRILKIKKKHESV